MTACAKFNPLVNGGDYVGTYCCVCGEKKDQHATVTATQELHSLLDQLDAAIKSLPAPDTDRVGDYIIETEKEIPL